MLGREGLTLSSGTFGTTYFTLTGFHGAHVFGGVIMLGVVLYRGMAGQFSPSHHDAVEAASLYWHFVDVVWILLFSLLYLLPGKPPASRRLTSMHPLRHPRNAIFVGIIFVVIGVLYWAIPTIGGWDVDYAGVTMLLALGRRDGDHGLRADRRVTTTDALDRRDACLTDHRCSKTSGTGSSS